MTNQLPYAQALEIMHEIGYNECTSLQEKAFKNIEYGSGAREFILGSTSTGKTIIPIISYIADRIKNSSGAKMLYIVPYRALAKQKESEFVKIFRRYKLNVLVSTSEYSLQDVHIKNGNCDVVILIYEKVFYFLSQDKSFLKKFDYIVYDELGIIENEERGGKCDYILLESCSIKNNSIYVLATPYFNWDVYINKYNFHTIIEKNRPIEIVESFIKYTMPCKNSNNYIKNATYLDFCMSKIIDVCLDHYRQGHKILVFNNSRKDVRSIVHRLYEGFVRAGIFDQNEFTVAECKQIIIDKLDLSYDDLGSIYDRKEDLKAYAAGIAFHNASLPEELRALIEQEFLSDNGSLKIVVATETLAFGINSNVETVIISNIMKQVNYEEKHVKRPLTVNEFMNYKGRSGRMGYCQRGYLYTVLMGNLQEKMYNNIKSKEDAPDKIKSTYDKIINNIDMSLHLLNFFNKAGISMDELIIKMSELPLSDNTNLNLKLNKIISTLKDRGLIEEIEDEFFQYKIYRLSAQGERIKGYIVSVKTYDVLQRISRKLNSGSKIYLFDLLYDFSKMEEFHNKKINDPELLINYAHHMPKFLNELSNLGEISPQCAENIKNSSFVVTYLKRHKNDKKNSISEKHITAYLGLVIAEAIYKWCKCYRMVDIDKICKFQYGDIKRIAEKMRYLINAISNTVWAQKYNDDLKKYLLQLGISLFYGINPEIVAHTDLLEIEADEGVRLRNIGRALYEYRHARGKTYEILKEHITKKYNEKHVEIFLRGVNKC